MEYGETLKEYFPEEEKKQVALKEISGEQLAELFAKLREALEELDMDSAEAVLNEMSECSFSEPQSALMAQMQEAVAEYDAEKGEEILQNWEQLLS